MLKKVLKRIRKNFSHFKIWVFGWRLLPKDSPQRMHYTQVDCCRILTLQPMFSALIVMKYFLEHGTHLTRKKTSRTSHIIWLATTWCTWNLRNSILLEGKVADMWRTVLQIKTVSWSWFISKVKRNSRFVFLDWLSNPTRCIKVT